MAEPSFSEMALNAAFESINAAQKSLIDEKGVKQSSVSNLLIQSFSGPLGKKVNQKSNSSLNYQKLPDSQQPFSDTQDLPSELDTGISDKKNEKIKTDLSESQKPYSESDQNISDSKGDSSHHKLDGGMNKSELALQIADEALARGLYSALASQEVLSQAMNQETLTNAQSQGALEKMADGQNQEKMADGQNQETLGNNFKSQDEITKDNLRNVNGVRAVTTPLLLEKRKALQDKKAITDAKIKQASRISKTDIQNKKHALEEKKKIRDKKIKELSNIKSPELQIRKDLINRKKDNKDPIVRKNDDIVQQNEEDIQKNEDGSPAQKVAESTLALNLASEALQMAQKALLAELNSNPPASRNESIADIKKAAEALENSQQTSSLSPKSVETDESEQWINETISNALLEARKSLQNLADILIQDKISNDEQKSRSDVEKVASDLASIAIGNAEKSLINLSNAISTAAASKQIESNSSENINSLENRSKFKVNEQDIQSKLALLEKNRAERMEKIKEKAKITSPTLQEKKKIFTDMGNIKKAIIDQFAKIKSPDLRDKRKNLDEKKEIREKQIRKMKQIKESEIIAKKEKLKAPVKNIVQPQQSSQENEVQPQANDPNNHVNDVRPQANDLNNRENEVQAQANDPKNQTNEVQAQTNDPKNQINEMQAQANDLKNQTNEVQAQANDLTNQENEVQPEENNLLPQDMTAQPQEKMKDVIKQPDQNIIPKYMNSLFHEENAVDSHARTQDFEAVSPTQAHENINQTQFSAESLNKVDFKENIINENPQKIDEYTEDFDEVDQKSSGDMIPFNNFEEENKKTVRISEATAGGKLRKSRNNKSNNGRVTLASKSHDLSLVQQNKKSPSRPESVDSTAKNTRTLLSQQKKNFQIKVGQLKHRIKLLKYQRNPQLDPSIEAKYFPQLARQPYLKSSSCITDIPSRVTDSFALNPPSWSSDRPQTAPRQKANAEGLSGDEMGWLMSRPHSAPPAKAEELVIGARVCVLLNGQRCLGSLQYFGNFDKYNSMWCGIELDRPLGTHNGVFKNVRYFECPESHGLFVKAERLIPLRSKIAY